MIRAPEPELILGARRSVTRGWHNQCKWSGAPVLSNPVGLVDTGLIKDYLSLFKICSAAVCKRPHTVIPVRCHARRLLFHSLWKDKGSGCSLLRLEGRGGSILPLSLLPLLLKIMRLYRIMPGMRWEDFYFIVYFNNLLKLNSLYIITLDLMLVLYIVDNRTSSQDILTRGTRVWINVGCATS